MHSLPSAPPVIPTPRPPRHPRLLPPPARHPCPAPAYLYVCTYLCVFVRICTYYSPNLVANHAASQSFMPPNPPLLTPRRSFAGTGGWRCRPSSKPAGWSSTGPYRNASLCPPRNASLVRRETLPFSVQKRLPSPSRNASLLRRETPPFVEKRLP